MDTAELIKIIADVGIPSGLLIYACVWLAPRTVDKASKSREAVAKLHSEDINHICISMNETTNRLTDLFRQQMTLQREEDAVRWKEERDQCFRQFEMLMERSDDAHREVLRAIEVLAKVRA